MTNFKLGREKKMKPKVKKQKKNDKDINLLYFDKNENKTINKGKLRRINC